MKTNYHLTEAILTPSERQKLVSGMQAIVEGRFAHKRITSELAKVLTATQMEAFGLDLKVAKIDPADTSALGEMLQKSIKQLSSIPVVHIDGAYLPSYSFSQTLKDWFSEVVGEQVLIDWNFNTTLLAGLIVEYNGKHYDYSLQNYLTNLGKI